MLAQRSRWLGCLCRNGVQCRSVSSLQHLPPPFDEENVKRTLHELNNDEGIKKLFKGYEVGAGGRNSAVLIPLCLSKGKPSILFNLRSNRLTRHKGYPCFPGGVTDKTDSDNIHTALRETHEELGIEAKNVRVFGSLPTFANPRDKMHVTAVVGYIGDIDEHTLNINYEEVSVVFTRTIEELCAEEFTGETVFRGQSGLYTTPVFVAGNYKVWGLTAMILHLFMGRLVPDLYKRPPRPVVFKRGYTASM